jgi:hypothetical protein
VIYAMPPSVSAAADIAAITAAIAAPAAVGHG